MKSVDLNSAFKWPSLYYRETNERNREKKREKKRKIERKREKDREKERKREKRREKDVQGQLLLICIKFAKRKN